MLPPMLWEHNNAGRYPRHWAGLHSDIEASTDGCAKHIFRIITTWTTSWSAIKQRVPHLLANLLANLPARSQDRFGPGTTPPCTKSLVCATSARNSFQWGSMDQRMSTLVPKLENAGGSGRLPISLARSLADVKGLHQKREPTTAHGGIRTIPAHASNVRHFPASERYAPPLPQKAVDAAPFRCARSIQRLFAKAAGGTRINTEEARQL